MEVCKMILLDVLFLIEQVSFCYVVLKKEWKPSGSRERWCLLAGLLLFGILVAAGCNEHILNWTFALVVILFYRYVFEKSILRACVTYLISCLFSGVMECAIGIMIFKEADFLGKTLITILVIVGTWIYHFLVGRKLDREIFQLPLPLWGMLAAFLLLMFLMLSYFHFLLMSVVREDMLITGNVLVLFGGIGICGLVIGIAYYFSRTTKYRLEKKNVEKYNEQQREYFTKLLEKEQDTRQFRHDIIWHLVAMEELCEQEDYEKVKEYLNSLLTDVQRISNAQYHVGNDIVDTIINYYFQPIQDICSIKVEGSMGEEQLILQNDLCVLISNLAKNAVEAVAHLPEEQRKIYFLVSQGRDNLRIRMENTYTGTLQIDKNGNIKTIKKDTRNHGYGVKNVMKIIEKYDGAKDINTDNNRFIVDVTFKAPNTERFENIPQ